MRDFTNSINCKKDCNCKKVVQGFDPIGDILEVFPKDSLGKRSLTVKIEPNPVMLLGIGIGALTIGSILIKIYKSK